MRRPLFETDGMENAQSPTPKRPTRRTMLAWFWVLCWGGTIWTLGGDWRTRYRILVAIRKSAHFIEYAILALLTFRAALLSAGRRTRFVTAGWVAIFIVTSLATADEARQAFSPVRTGSPYDILIDVAGGLLTVLGLLVISRRMRPAGATESSV